MVPTRIEFDLTADDLAANTRVIARQDGVVRKQQNEARIASLILIAVGLVSGAAVAVLEPDPLTTGFLIAWPLVIIGVGIWPTRRKLDRQAEAHARKALSDPAYRMALGRRVVEIHPDGLTGESAHGRSEVTWRSVVRTHCDDDYLFLTFPGPTAFPIPRTAFATDDEFDRFVDEVYRRIEKSGGHTGDSPPDDPGGAEPE